MINKKAQVSIEVTIVLAILVIGAVSLGVYYISNVNRYKEEAGRLDDNLNKLEDQGEFGEEESVPATCSDGVQNQGETGIDCGGPCNPCITTPPPSPFNTLTLVTSTPNNVISQPFIIEVSANMGEVKVSKLEIKKDGRATSYCKPTAGTVSSLGVYTDLGIIPSSPNPLFISIDITDCDATGSYEFTVTGEYQGHTIRDTETITITPNTFSTVLLSSVSSNYYTNNNFNINIETNLGGVNITTFKVFEDVSGSLLPTPNCTVYGGNSANGVFANVGTTNITTKILGLTINCNTAGKYSFNAIGEYLGVQKTSNRLTTNINDQPPPPVLALSIDPTPKMYEYFSYNEAYIKGGCPNIMFDLNFSSNNKETNITEIEIRKKSNYASYHLTDDCLGETLVKMDTGRFSVSPSVIEPFSLIIPNFRCNNTGNYRIIFKGEKEGFSAWSSPLEIYVSDAFAYSESLVRNVSEEYFIFVYSSDKESAYAVPYLSIEKKNEAGIYINSNDCRTNLKAPDDVGEYSDLGDTQEVFGFKNLEVPIVCSDKGEYRFNFFVEGPSGELRALEPLYITVRE